MNQQLKHDRLVDLACAEYMRQFGLTLMSNPKHGHVVIPLSNNPYEIIHGVEHMMRYTGYYVNTVYDADSCTVHGRLV